MASGGDDPLSEGRVGGRSSHHEVSSELAGVSSKLKGVSSKLKGLAVN
jgi:hypothetical protein